MSKLRITGGIYVRRRIECPPGEIRPAMDRMRESLFSVLGDLTGCSFLDLFSGSGVIGIEAASRGAAPVVLVESDPGKKPTILRNLTFVGSIATLRIMTAERFLRQNDRLYDVVFLDPPFRHPDKVSLLRAVDEGQVLGEAGRVLLHRPREEDIPSHVGGLLLTDSRKYGRSIVDFFTRRPIGR